MALTVVLFLRPEDVANIFVANIFHVYFLEVLDVTFVFCLECFIVSIRRSELNCVYFILSKTRSL